MSFWRKGTNPAEVLAYVSGSRKILDEKSFQSARINSHEEWLAVLNTFVQADGISDARRARAIKIAARSHPELSVKAFESDFWAAVERLRASEKNFKVVMPIWGPRGLLIGRRRSGGGRVQFYPV